MTAASGARSAAVESPELERGAAREDRVTTARPGVARRSRDAERSDEKARRGRKADKMGVVDEGSGDVGGDHGESEKNEPGPERELSVGQGERRTGTDWCAHPASRASVSVKLSS